ncbi:MAG: TraM recognition domain-containing protein [Sulfitobacter sp.]|nr:TraM recognition domain-containing protein [Sulfitobacter sp.]
MTNPSDGPPLSREAIPRGRRRTARRSSVAGREADARAERNLLGRLDQPIDDLLAAVGRFHAAADAGRTSAAAMEAQLEAAADRTLERTRSIIGTNAAQQLIESRSRVVEIVGRLAAGPASAPATDETWFSHQPDQLEVPRFVRVGSASLPSGTILNETTTVPLMLPLLGERPLAVLGPSSPLNDELILTMLARQLASMAPGQLVVSHHDPRLRSPLAVFGALISSRLSTPALTDGSTLLEVLGNLSNEVSRVGQLLGGQFETLRDLNTATGRAVEPHRLLALFDFPHGHDERSFDQVVRLVERGSKTGVHVLLQVDQKASCPRERSLGQVLEACEQVYLDGDRPSLGGFDGLELMLDPPLGQALIGVVCDRATAGARDAAAPAVDFGDLLPPVGQLGTQASADRLVATIGRQGVVPVSFTLGDRLENLHNVLIGGAVGQGKSNLLLVILHSLAASYPPEELEFHLLDFKEGLEFSRLAPASEGGGLPQATVIGLETDRQFGLAVLQGAVEEFERRSKAFKRSRSTNLADHRAATGADPMPRLVLVLDEFQVLLADDDVCAEAIGHLENLARKGRAYGIHLILASQTLSGIEALYTKESSIFSQFPVRIAHKTTSGESQILLAQGNTEASELRYRGEAILNRNYGTNTSDNERVTIAYADEDVLATLRSQLSQRYPAVNAPLVFSGGELPPLDTEPRILELENDGPSIAWLGRPVALKQDPPGFRPARRPGSNLAILGGGQEDEPLGVLSAAVVSLVLSSPPGTRLVLLDGDERARIGLSALSLFIEQAGLDVEVVAPQEVGPRLRALAEQVAERGSDPSVSHPSIYVVGFGMHSLIGLDHPDPVTFEKPLDHLHALLRDGPSVGCHLIGWWPNAYSYHRHVDYSVDGSIQMFCFTKIGRNDIQDILGPLNRWEPQELRALVFDRSSGENGSLVVPFAPASSESLGRISELVTP